VVARLRKIVSDNVLFKHLSSGQITEVVDAMNEVNYEVGSVIMREGDSGDHMYIIDHGELEVLYSDEVVAVLTDGKSFGEQSLMYNCPRTATIRVRSHLLPSELLLNAMTGQNDFILVGYGSPHI